MDIGGRIVYIHQLFPAKVKISFFAVVLKNSVNMNKTVINKFITLLKKIIFLFSFVIIFSGCVKYQRIEQTKDLMGTFVRITVYDRDRTNASKTIELAFKEIEKVDRLMNTYKEDSEISRLNRNGYLDSISTDLAYVISKAQYYSEISDGAFDITVKPVLELYRNSFETKNSPPNQDELTKTLKLVDYRNVVLSDRSVELKTKGCMITLGGIAKGYTIDRAIEVLKKNGINHGLVNAGGDIRTLGTKPDGSRWQVALQNPRDSNDFIAKLQLNDKAVATSGDYERYFDKDKLVHHIINPKTGKSATELISVTVVTDKAIDADTLSTTVFVLGKERGMELIEKLEGVEALIITSDRKIFKSKGFENLE